MREWKYVSRLSDKNQMLILTYISEKIRQRAFLGLVPQFWFLPCIFALAVLPSDAPKWGSYAVLTVLLSYPSRENSGPP